MRSPDFSAQKTTQQQALPPAVLWVPGKEHSTSICISACVCVCAEVKYREQQALPMHSGAPQPLPGEMQSPIHLSVPAVRKERSQQRLCSTIC